MRYISQGEGKTGTGGFVGLPFLLVSKIYLKIELVL